MILEKKQKAICKKNSSDFVKSIGSDKCGIARNFNDTVGPIHGMRQQDSGKKTWYFWKGDYSTDDDFFVPLHINHLNEWSELIPPYLALDAGFRFILDDEGYEDVWFDKNLIEN